MNGPIFPNTDEAPTANKFSRGWLAIVFGESGVADVLKWVRRKADGTFDAIEVPVAAYAAGGADVAVADGGTGASTAANARTNLGVPALVSPAFPGYVDFAEIASPATPATGFVRLYALADGKLYVKDDAGTETALF